MESNKAKGLPLSLKKFISGYYTNNNIVDVIKAYEIYLIDHAAQHHYGTCTDMQDWIKSELTKYEGK